MEFLRPGTWDEALALRAARPDAVTIAGGTDVMVDLNFDRRRPAALLDLGRIGDLTQWSTVDGWIRLGAGVPYARIVAELADALPGLAIASRTVGSPQIRNRGTVGGNLGSASPAGDAHPPLLVSDAVVEAQSPAGTRDIPIGEFYTGVKRSALRDDELIAAVRVPVARGPQQFAKIGTRNAMVIAVCSMSLAIRPDAGAVAVAIGSAAPTPRRCPDAETFIATELADRRLWTTRAAVPGSVAERFGELVAGTAAPIDDVRGTASYRRHALSVLARRTLAWAWQQYREEARTCAWH